MTDDVHPDAPGATTTLTEQGGAPESGARRAGPATEVTRPPATEALDAGTSESQHGHASESYFVIGEGLLNESGGGREIGTADEVVADGDRRALSAAAAAPPFRFTRMGPKGRQLPRATRARVARAMTAGGGGASGIPAGYTYLGQFVDHDLTFDKTKVTLGANVAPADLLQGRSPSLDLDSLYGAGPADPGSARFYAADGRKLKMGRTEAAGSGPLDVQPGFDLPRRSTLKRALIPDHRNDENLAVAQTHLAFIRFHNRVVDELGSVPAAQRFARARRSVVKHYQWMIRHDYLPRICEASVLDDVFPQRPQGLRSRRDADGRPDHADRVLGRRVPPRAQHDPPGL